MSKISLSQKTLIEISNQIQLTKEILCDSASGQSSYSAEVNKF